MENNNETQTYRIQWLSDWIENIHPLQRDQFVCYDICDRNFYDIAVESEYFEVVILIDQGMISEMWSKTPYIYSEERRILVVTPELIAELDKKTAEALADPVFAKLERIIEVIKNHEEHGKSI